MDCANSAASAHFFSADGRDWHYSPQPYGHTVSYDDGTSHTYVTLERPNLHFNASGVITHINLAADLVTGNEGCANRTSHAHNGHCPCDNCKASGRARAPRCSALACVAPSTPQALVSRCHSLAPLPASSGTTTLAQLSVRWVSA